MITCTRKINFCAGHRVWQHEGKCASIHGHEYSADITVTAKELDVVGRIVDFSVLKEIYQTWVDQWWDHGFIYYYKDYEVRAMFEHITTKKFEFPYNPTAENISLYLGTDPFFVQVLAQKGVECIKVVVHETRKCSGTWMRD